VGAELYDTVYLPALLLLSAARAPVTLAQLGRWGVRLERLRFALLDLGDFLRQHRGRRWHDSLNEDGEDRYEVAHEEFVDFVATDAELAPRYRQAHATIAETALAAHAGRWEEIDPTDEAAVYDLRFLPAHLQLAGGKTEEGATFADEGYGRGCNRTGVAFADKGRVQVAVELFDQMLVTYRQLAESEARAGPPNDLVKNLMNRRTAFGRWRRLRWHLRDVTSALVNKGVALRGLGRLAEAVGCYDEAIALRRRLVKQEGGAELANDLARALVNKGGALKELGRLGEAVSCCDEAVAVLRRLVEHEGRAELANDLALALMNKGVALDSLGRLAEAVGCYDEAIGVLRRLVEHEGRAELANDLARALNNKGNALQRLGRLGEAVGCYDETIAMLRRLVEHEGRAELANDLARALVNKGAALDRLGRLAEAVGCHDEAIALLRRLVEHEGRAELANDLAKALANQGNALRGLGRPAEALGCYDEAIALRRRLVQHEGRAELADDLAKVLVRKALVLEKQEQWDDALAHYEESIRWREACVRAGMTHRLAELLQTIRYRLSTVLDLRRWPEAAAGVIRALEHLAPALRNGEPPARVLREREALVARLRQLPAEDREQVLAGLGEWRETLQGWLAR
jgi:tetratricopeptide (TPR) repeat protein